MSKPLELTIYPEWQHADGTWYATIDDPRYPVRSEVEVLRKRFQPGELAAEYWHQHGRFDLTTEGYPTDAEGAYFASKAREYEILSAIERFATLPHYDEAAA